MNVKFLIGLFLYLNIVNANKKSNNVCSTFIDYFFPNISPNCWYDPDTESDIYEITERRNIPLEVYNVTTEDGYILTLFRLKKDNFKGVVILQHPLLTTGVIWFNNGNNSLAVMLYNEGYEVWLPNTRGTFYSNKHVNLSVTDYAYWDFSFHEIGIYDLPAQFDFIKKITNSSSFYYVGYSISTTTAIVYASERPEHAKNTIKAFILIGPTIYVNFKILDHNLPIIDIGKNLSETYRFGTAASSYKLTNFFVKNLCVGHPFKALCLIGSQYSSLNVTDPALIPFMFNNYRARISLKPIFHFKQINNSGLFQYFDYGKEGNLLRYKSVYPPLYPIRDINVPIYLIYGGKDQAAPPENVERFYRELPQKAVSYGKHFVPSYNHFNFLLGKGLKELIYDHVIGFINNLN